MLRLRQMATNRFRRRLRKQYWAGIVIGTLEKWCPPPIPHPKKEKKCNEIYPRNYVAIATLRNNVRFSAVQAGVLANEQKGLAKDLFP